MRIAIIVFVGILSYFAVVLPGYFYFVPGGAEEISNLKTFTELPVEDAAKSSTEINISNPGDAPPPKWSVTYYSTNLKNFTQLP